MDILIDLITSLDGVDNSDILAGRIEADFFGLNVPIISKAHLIQNKKAAGRPQDLLDVENLE